MTGEETGSLPIAVTKAYDVLLWLMVRLAHHERTFWLRTSSVRKMS